MPDVIEVLRTSWRRHSDLPIHMSTGRLTSLREVDAALAGAARVRRACNRAVTNRRQTVTHDAAEWRPRAEVVVARNRSTSELVEAERRVPDVAQYAGGVSSDSQHAALRASVRQLGQLLGEALTRHEGPELLALVEQVRRLARRAPTTTSCTPCSTASTTPRRSCWPARSPRTSSW